MTDYGRTPSDVIKSVHSVSPQVVNNTSVNGTGVSLQSWDAAQITVNVGAIAGTNITVKLQESSDDGDADAYADITDATTGAITDADEIYLFDLNCSEVELYVRPVVTTTGAGDTLVGVVVNLMSGRHLVPDQQNVPTQVGYDQLA